MDKNKKKEMMSKAARLLVEDHLRELVETINCLKQGVLEGEVDAFEVGSYKGIIDKGLDSLALALIW